MTYLKTITAGANIAEVIIAWLLMCTRLHDLRPALLGALAMLLSSCGPGSSQPDYLGSAMNPSGSDRHGIYGAQFGLRTKYIKRPPVIQDTGHKDRQYIFETCLSKNDGTLGELESSQCVNSFRLALGDAFALSTSDLSELRSLVFDEAGMLSETYEAWQEYHDAVSRRNVTRGVSAALVVGGVALAPHVRALSHRYDSTYRYDHPDVTKWTQENQRWYGQDVYMSPSEGLARAQDIEEAFFRSGLSLERPLTPTISGEELHKFNHSILSDDFLEHLLRESKNSQWLEIDMTSGGSSSVDFTDPRQWFPRFSSESRVYSSRYELRGRWAGHPSSELPKMVRRFLNRGYGVRDIIREEYWPRFAEYLRIEYEMGGSKSADVVELFSKSPLTGLQKTHEFVAYRGVSPSARIKAEQYAKFISGLKASPREMLMSSKGQLNKIKSRATVFAALLAAGATLLWWRADHDVEHASKPLSRLGTKGYRGGNLKLLVHDLGPVINDGAEKVFRLLSTQKQLARFFNQYFGRKYPNLIIYKSCYPMTNRDGKVREKCEPV